MIKKKSSYEAAKKRAELDIERNVRVETRKDLYHLIQKLGKYAVIGAIGWKAAGGTTVILSNKETIDALINGLFNNLSKYYILSIVILVVLLIVAILGILYLQKIVVKNCKKKIADLIKDNENYQMQIRELEETNNKRLRSRT